MLLLLGSFPFRVFTHSFRFDWDFENLMLTMNQTSFFCKRTHIIYLSIILLKRTRTPFLPGLDRRGPQQRAQGILTGQSRQPPNPGLLPEGPNPPAGEGRGVENGRGQKGRGPPRRGGTRHTHVRKRRRRREGSGKAAEKVERG